MNETRNDNGKGIYEKKRNIENGLLEKELEENGKLQELSKGERVKEKETSRQLSEAYY